MSGILQQPISIHPDYLVDDFAMDVSRMTGIPWQYSRTHNKGPLRPYMDLVPLDWYDRMRVVFSLIMAYNYIIDSR